MLRVGKEKKKITNAQATAFAFLIIITVLWLIPLIYGVFTSFKSELEIRSVGFQLLPRDWTLNNYIKSLSNTTSAPMLRWFVNSIIISFSHTALMIFIVSLTAYGYSRLNFPGRDKLFFAIFAISMFPDVVSLIPRFGIVNALGWVDTILAVIIPGLGTMVNVFLVRQFMRGIPMEYDESARMDGASNFKIYIHVVLPMVKPIMTVVALFSFTSSWNDLLWTSIVFNDVNRMTMTVGLELMKNLYGDYMYLGQLMAGAIFALLPTFLLFLFTQKYFIQSLSLSSGVKG